MAVPGHSKGSSLPTSMAVPQNGSELAPMVVLRRTLRVASVRGQARSVWSARSLLPLFPADARKSGSKLAALQTLRAVRPQTSAHTPITICGRPVLVGKEERLRAQQLPKS